MDGRRRLDACASRESRDANSPTSQMVLASPRQQGLSRLSGGFDLAEVAESDLLESRERYLSHGVKRDGALSQRDAACETLVLKQREQPRHCREADIWQPHRRFGIVTVAIRRLESYSKPIGS